MDDDIGPQAYEYILYVWGSDPNGLKALRYVQFFPHLFVIRDVSDLKTIPEWLTGIPSLLSLSTKKLYRGSHALQKLAALKKKLDKPPTPPPPPFVPPESKKADVVPPVPPKIEQKVEQKESYDPLPKPDRSEDHLKSKTEETFTPFPKPDRDSKNPPPTPTPPVAPEPIKTVEIVKPIVEKPPEKPPEPPEQKQKTTEES
jgi:hypothetical protein